MPDPVHPRLNKVLAQAGIASRRAADRLIAEGRVIVNGSVVRELGLRVDLSRDTVKVDGKRIPPAPASRLYLMVHKPKGCMTTLSDPEGRQTILDLIPGVRRRVYPVGRLDYQSEGLLLLTDDGDLSRDLMHPSHGVPKTYHVKVRGQPPPEALTRLRRGVTIEGRRTLPAKVRQIQPGANAWLEITVHEGRKHQIRLMLESVGHMVVKLRRTRYGGVDLGDLPPGEYRPLTDAEVARLRRSALASAKPPPKRPRAGRRPT